MKKRMLALLLGLLFAGLTACGSTDTAAKDETPSAPTVWAAPKSDIVDAIFIFVLSFYYWILRILGRKS